LYLPAALALIQQAEAILSAHEEPVSSEQVLELVSRRSCSAYGCEFVVAARQMGVPLVTEDQMILAALPLEARHLHQPSS
jgi:predicted nucleic acid-binding protein